MKTTPNPRVLLRRARSLATGALLLTLAACSPDPAATQAQPPEADSAASPEAMPAQTAATEPLLVPADFEVPVNVETDGFKVVPLGPDLTDIDYAAYMSSIEHLQQTFTRSDRWPTKDLDRDDAILDMQTEQARFERRESFAYGVLTPDGSRERGCVYVRPATKPGYDATVSLWVTKAEYDAGFDAELYEWVQEWIDDAWPFDNVAYPGRKIEWVQWDVLPDIDAPNANDPALIAANTATAEAMIDAFYSFDAERLAPFLEAAGPSQPRIADYQGWAEGGNYKVLKRPGCTAESAQLVICPVTVQDDPVQALKTGFDVTDTFALTFNDAKIVAINTSSNDQPIYYEARQWVEENMPEVMNGPCSRDAGRRATPGDCARAMTAGYKKFYETVVANRPPTSTET
ncbi:MAG: hypothetical protein AAF648_07625 [Pseudomonadota bacterium]